MTCFHHEVSKNGYWPKSSLFAGIWAEMTCLASLGTSALDQWNFSPLIKLDAVAW
uniref:Uncharacterized protein n=1 Tax=Arundo donax TaxID=35708 RepID=A0A0A8ZRX3_ARUDO